MTTLLMVIIVIAAIALIGGAVAWYVFEQDKRRRQIREEFGPEYHRTLARTGDRGKAQRELEDRKKRVSSFDLKALPREVAERFRNEWRSIQERFVDEPKDATTEADGLVQQVMNECGYPMAEFDQRAADISVDHPDVVQNYRRAHQISQANERGEASTEDLRQAFVYYRALFLDLLEPEGAPADGGPPVTRLRFQQYRGDDMLRSLKELFGYVGYGHCSFRFGALKGALTDSAKGHPVREKDRTGGFVNG